MFFFQLNNKGDSLIYFLIHETDYPNSEFGWYGNNKDKSEIYFYQDNAGKK